MDVDHRCGMSLFVHVDEKAEEPRVENRRSVACHLFVNSSARSSLSLSLSLALVMYPNVFYTCLRSLEHSPLVRTPFQVRLRCLRCVSTCAEFNGTVEKVSRMTVNEALHWTRLSIDGHAARYVAVASDENRMPRKQRERDTSTFIVLRIHLLLQ